MRVALVGLVCLLGCGGARPHVNDGPVSGEVESARFEVVATEGVDCDYCGGRHDVWATLRSADGATITVHADPDRSTDDVELTSRPYERSPDDGPIRAYVVWQHDGSLRAAGHLRIDERTAARLRGCLDVTFDGGGHAAGCFDVALEHSAGYE